MEHKNSTYKISFAFAVLLITVSACAKSSNLTVDVYSNQEKIPSPRFTVLDPTEVGEKPRFSDVRVYDESSGCEVPKCPIIWRVVLNDEGSPIEFQYGDLHILGSSALVTPEMLRSGGKYRLVVGPNSDMDHKAKTGELGFTVNPQGFLETIK